MQYGQTGTNAVIGQWPKGVVAWLSKSRQTLDQASYHHTVTCRLLPSIAIITIYYSYYSVQRLIIILLSHGV